MTDYNYMSIYQDGKLEGIMTILEELYIKERGTEEITKDYVIEKLTELNLSWYIDRIITMYYSEKIN